ncbi:tetraspanin-8-like [Sphaeramia orbicularis]|uniref:Tetraspanin n=1 Tax=Sphaeramia orbicularis TaxID=375764 RepID=A0A673A5Z6_9TELE|nr:tetraspanin-8-like [Sphaeramia orbicularis]
MAQINTCLKRTFTIFNILFAIVGGLIILVALLAQVFTNLHGGEDMVDRTVALILLYVVGIITMAIAILGAYGAHKESKGALIAFLVCMVIGSLMMLRAGVTNAIARPNVETVLDEKFRHLLPLDQQTEDKKELMDIMQTKLHCCGLYSYKDWEGNIPDSCLCAEEEEEETCQVINHKHHQLQKSIYSKPCFPILLHYVTLFVDIMIGIAFTLGPLALLGMALSSIMIHQLRYPNRPTVLVVPAVFTPQPPKYQELHNPPAY